MSGEAIESAAPAQSTRDIVANVIETSEAESSASESAPVETSTETPAAEAKPITQEELSRAAKFLVAKGHKWGKRADKPNVDAAYLPSTTVARMMDEYVADHQKEWDGSRSELEKARDQYKAYVDEITADLRGDPRALIEKIAQHDPRYRALLEPPKVEPPAPSLTQLPEPDADWNGAKTWSMEAFQKSVIPYIVQQAQAAAKAEAEGMLKPLREREQQTEFERAQSQRVQSLMADAKTWPGWDEHEQDILKALRDDSAQAQATNSKPKLSLEAAYRQVVIPKLTAKLAEDDAKKREKLIAEQNTAAKTGPTLTPSATESPRSAKPLSNRDIVARTLANLEKQGA